MDKVNTERLCSCPAAEEESKVVKEAQGSRNKGQEGRKRLEESRKLDSMRQWGLTAGTGGETVNWET